MNIFLPLLVSFEMKRVSTSAAIGKVRRFPLVIAIYVPSARGELVSPEKCRPNNLFLGVTVLMFDA